MFVSCLMLAGHSEISIVDIETYSACNFADLGSLLVADVLDHVV